MRTLVVYNDFLYVLFNLLYGEKLSPYDILQFLTGSRCIPAAIGLDEIYQLHSQMTSYLLCLHVATSTYFAEVVCLFSAKKF